MALESVKDFDSYLDNRALAIKADFFEVQQALWDSRAGFVDTWLNIDLGDNKSINIIMEDDYFSILGAGVNIAGHEPTATIKSSDAPYISHEDEIHVHAVTSKKGETIKPATQYKIINVQNDKTGFIKLRLQKQ
jgi:hypothetical protein